jgi:hypothetical protein
MSNKDKARDLVVSVPPVVGEVESVGGVGDRYYCIVSVRVCVAVCMGSEMVGQHQNQ